MLRPSLTLALAVALGWMTLPGDGDTATFEFVRNGERQTVTMTLAEAPAQ